MLTENLSRAQIYSSIFSLYSYSSLLCCWQFPAEILRQRLGDAPVGQTAAQRILKQTQPALAELPSLRAFAQACHTCRLHRDAALFWSVRGGLGAAVRRQRRPLRLCDVSRAGKRRRKLREHSWMTEISRLKSFSLWPRDTQGHLSSPPFILWGWSIL